jgi:hypothetical protein
MKRIFIYAGLVLSVVMTACSATKEDEWFINVPMVEIK